MPEFTGDFNDRRNTLTYWYPKINTSSVPLPETHFFDVSNAEDEFELRDNESGPLGFDMESVKETLDSIPVTEISEVVSNFDSEYGHIRGEWKSTQFTAEQGGKISTDPQDIHKQVIELLTSLSMSQFPAEQLVVREWIELNEFENAYGQSIGPEVRIIVDNGEVLTSFVDVYESDFEYGHTDETIETGLAQIETEYQQSKAQLEDWAEIVANKLSETGWSVDFVQDSSGNWLLVDMALYGVYWNASEQQYHNISAIPDGNPYNLEEQLTFAFETEKIQITVNKSLSFFKQNKKLMKQKLKTVK